VDLVGPVRPGTCPQSLHNVPESQNPLRHHQSMSLAFFGQRDAGPAPLYEGNLVGGALKVSPRKKALPAGYVQPSKGTLPVAATDPRVRAEP
jgi:hypothetical protein